MLRPNIKMLAEVMLNTGDACTGIMLPVSSLAVLKACGQPSMFFIVASPFLESISTFAKLRLMMLRLKDKE
jgi:hypothetical protein